LQEKSEMLTVRITLILALIVGFAGWAGAQAPGTTPIQPPVAAPAAANLRIVSPDNNQKIAVDFIGVRYQITNPAAGTNTLPTFQLQLDNKDPIRTSSTEHTFTGLTPGVHKIAVELVDANDTPIAGTRTEVHFVVAPKGPIPATTGTPASPKSAAQKSESPSNSADNLPPTGSALPLLSIIGFGVLVGGIASALKTR
jgi:hypothetical protein